MSLESKYVQKCTLADSVKHLRQPPLQQPAAKQPTKQQPPSTQQPKPQPQQQHPFFSTFRMALTYLSYFPGRASSVISLGS